MKTTLRPAGYLLLGGMVVVLLACLGIVGCKEKRDMWQTGRQASQAAVISFGLSDLVLSTEARYTRHPAVSDRVVPGMDHPGAIEHFPSGSFFAPVE